MRRSTSTTIWEIEKIKGSRFIAQVSPVRTPAEAETILAVIRAQHRLAGHHCFAYRLANGQQRASDDGEPRGSGGAPILTRIEHLELVDTLVVVTRYFGGIKLGVGGLIRAYGGAAGQALEMCALEEVQPGVLVRLGYAYADTAAVERCCSAVELEVIEEEFSTTVSRTIWVALSARQQLEQALREASSGRIQWSEDPQ